jgi:ribonuclease VapC
MVFVGAVMGRASSGHGADRLYSRHTSRLNDDARPIVDHFLSEYGLTVMAVDQDQMTTACEAMLQFGRSRHRAALNFGDCFAYALSRVSGEPLLFRGKDFSETDVVRAA